MKISSYTEKSPIFQMYRLHNVVQAYFSECLKSYKINFIQSLILLTIYFEGKNKITPMSLVRELGLSKSSVSQALSQLESRGWIKRRMDKEDARSLSLVLTAEGKVHATKIIAIFDGLEKKFEKLGKSRSDQLTESLKTVSSIIPTARP
jgi:DNA-binding MarR family transcriptional regulator